MIIDQIKAIYPSLTDDDFRPGKGTILIQDNSDGNGPYIAQWNNPNPQPTAEQLIATGK
jgi:hypothetical protein